MIFEGIRPDKAVSRRIPWGIVDFLPSLKDRRSLGTAELAPA